MGGLWVDGLELGMVWRWVGMDGSVSVLVSFLHWQLSAILLIGAWLGLLD